MLICKAWITHTVILDRYQITWWIGGWVGGGTVVCSLTSQQNTPGFDFCLIKMFSVCLLGFPLSLKTMCSSERDSKQISRAHFPCFSSHFCLCIVKNVSQSKRQIFSLKVLLETAAAVSYLNHIKHILQSLPLRRSRSADSSSGSAQSIWFSFAVAPRLKLESNTYSEVISGYCIDFL